MRCPSCGNKVKRSQSRCPHCGELLVPMAPTFGGAAVEVRPSLGYRNPVSSAAAAAAATAKARSKKAGIITASSAAVLILALLIWCFVAGPLKPTASGIALSSSVFPDAAFRAVVRTYDSNSDGVLSSEEIAAITTLDAAGRDIGSLQGIANLSALSNLNAQANNLASVDLSSNTQLVSVNLSQNQLSQITLGELPQLTYLDVSVNVLAALDVSGCTSLQSLACTGNQIARLNLATNRLVRQLSIDLDQSVTIPIAEGFFADEGLRNSLMATTVDLDGDGALSQRERDALTRLTISDSSTQNLSGLVWFSSLLSLDISNTAVTQLDGTLLPQSLTTLRADNSQLASLSLSSLRSLGTLSLRNTPLASLDLGTLSSLTSLDISGSAITELDATPVSALLRTLFVDEGVQVTGVVTNTSSCFPDSNLRAALFGSASNNPNGDDLLSEAEIKSLTSLDISRSTVADLTGIGQLSSLKTLNASGLSLGSFSCQGLSNLQTLYLSGCQLTSIDLSGAESLTTLDVSVNALSYLDLQPAARLQLVLATSNPDLAAIDIRGVELLADGTNLLRDENVTLIQTDAEAAAYEEAQHTQDDAGSTDGAESTGGTGNADGADSDSSVDSSS